MYVIIYFNSVSNHKGRPYSQGIEASV